MILTVTRQWFDGTLSIETDEYTEDHAVVVLFNNVPELATVTETLKDGRTAVYEKSGE